MSSDPSFSKLLVDSGNTCGGSTSYEIFKLKYILKIYDLLGYRAMNIGVNEASIPLKVLRNLDKELSLRLVSANVMVKESMMPALNPYIVVDINGLKIGITGVVREFDPLKVGEGLEILPPTDALARYLPELAEKAHLVILLSHLKPSDAEDIAKNNDLINIIINAQGPQPTTPQKVGNTILANIPGWGRKVGRLTLNFNKDGQIKEYMGLVTALTPSIKDHQGTVVILKEYKRALVVQGYYRYKEGIEDKKPSGDGYAGTIVCKDCHPQAYNVWKKSAHAHSLESLKRKDNQYDPGCLKCHVTGFNQIEGYKGEKETPDQAYITCEECHGSCKNHSLYTGEPRFQPLPLARADKDICFRCHSWEHSENFQVYTFWQKIKHGK